jgi:ribose 5-phosphate isomerase A
MTAKILKEKVAHAAIAYVPLNDAIIGIGTGSTVNYFIEALVPLINKIQGAVPSSNATRELLKKNRIPILELNEVTELAVYVDGADEVTQHKTMIKGGGGALTQEKILAQAAKKFICIVDETKTVDMLSENFPLPIEVIPMARSFVAREIVKLGGDPHYRQNFLTDNGNIILDVYNFKLSDPYNMEMNLNNIPGIVCNGIFAKRPADIVLIATQQQILEWK